MITVKDLILFLQQQPQDLPVAFQLHSELKLLELADIERDEHCDPRPDGWIHHKRPDRPSREYLIFPGN